jgi:hypothetical protein
MHESLRRYWPPEGQILLLIAALADLEAARQAWRQWQARQELADATSPEVRLLAAVARRIGDLEPTTPLDPRLLGARRYIWTHTQMTLGTTRPLLAAMRAEGVRLILLKGAARLAADPQLAQERALRDIDALVHPDDWEQAIRVAWREGWQHGKADRDLRSLRRAPALALRSPRPGASGEFDLHRFALTECRNEGQDDGLWQRAEPGRFLDIDVLRTSATDFALLALAQSMLYSEAPTAAHWALDVDPLIRTGRIDWELLLQETRVRRIEPYVAAPLLMLRERIGSPVPAAVLEALGRRLRPYALIEFETRAAGYGPRLPEQFEARRTLLAARAMEIARCTGAAKEDGNLVLPRPVRAHRLGPNESAEIPVPSGGPPFQRLSLYVEFDIHHARGHAYLTISTRSVPLKMIAIGRANKQAGRARRRLTVRCPACLYSLRDVETVLVRTNDRLEIRNVTLSWNRPVSLGPLAKLGMAVRRWRAEPTRPSAG